MLDRHRDFGALAAAFAHVADRTRETRTRESDTVSDRTWRDLSLDAVFARLDRCITSAGQQMLYRRLRQPSLAPSELRELDRRVQAFTADESLCTAAANALRPLTKTSTLALTPILHGAPPPMP